MLFGDTVKDNLQFPYKIRGDKVDLEKIKRGLLQFDLPLHSLDKKIDDLSGGEKQRTFSTARRAGDDFKLLGLKRK